MSVVRKLLELRPTSVVSLSIIGGTGGESIIEGYIFTNGPLIAPRSQMPVERTRRWLHEALAEV